MHAFSDGCGKGIMQDPHSSKNMENEDNTRRWKAATKYEWKAIQLKQLYYRTESLPCTFTLTWLSMLFTCWFHWVVLMLTITWSGTSQCYGAVKLTSLFNEQPKTIDHHSWMLCVVTSSNRSCGQKSVKFGNACISEECCKLNGYCRVLSVHWRSKTSNIWQNN